MDPGSTAFSQPGSLRCLRHGQEEQSDGGCSADPFDPGQGGRGAAGLRRVLVPGGACGQGASDLAVRRRGSAGRLGSPGQAKPGAPGTAGSRVASGAWRADASGTQQPLYAVACLSARRCEAVGAAGTILSTGDGGATWRAQANPLQGSSEILYRIACVAPSSCYVIARPGTILVTHDGGATWSSHVLALAGVGGNLTDQTCLADTVPPGSSPGRPLTGASGAGWAFWTSRASAPSSATPWPPGPQGTPTRRFPSRAGPGRRVRSG